MKYGIIKNLISDDLRHQMIDLMNLLKAHSISINDGDPNVNIPSDAFFGIFNTIQLKIMPEIENIFKIELVPTYNQSRIYYPNSILYKHFDKLACEYAITINLYQEKDSWPIFMQDIKNKENPISFKLNPGDAVWYKGCEVWHWREKNEYGIGYQTFMFFVDKNGKYSNRKYNKNEESWIKNLNNPMYQFYI